MLQGIYQLKGPALSKRTTICALRAGPFVMTTALNLEDCY